MFLSVGVDARPNLLLRPTLPLQLTARMLEHVTADMCSGFVDLTVSFPVEASSTGAANTGAHVWSSHSDRYVRLIVARGALMYYHHYRFPSSCII